MRIKKYKGNNTERDKIDENEIIYLSMAEFESWYQYNNDEFKNSDDAFIFYFEKIINATENDK
jgi:hypothetical protein